MQKLLTVLTLSLSLLLSGSALAKTWLLTNGEDNTEKGNWQITSDQLKMKGAPFTIEQKILHGGKQEGSKILTISSKDGLTIVLSPTRGMGILHVEGFGVHLGWRSPVKEVVNPVFINLESRNGAGWLEGFNEMLVRSGYEWAGHPVTTDSRRYTLHGKAGNTPASWVAVEVSDNPPHKVRIRGLIKESVFKKVDLQIMTELSYVPGSNNFTVHDVLTNHADYPHDYQIIYHSNFGKPILEEGARFIVPVESVGPFNDYAKTGLKSWQIYSGPTKDFDEMVFNIKPLADEKQQTLAALINKTGDKGVSIEFNIQQLPVLTLWKNTDTEKQGYVTGIEPGTSYSYPVTIEREQKRVKQLQSGETTQFVLTYTLLHNPVQVAKVEKKIAEIQTNKTPQLIETPMAKE